MTSLTPSRGRVQAALGQLGSRAKSSRILHGSFANLYGQGVQVAIQLASVPLMAACLGLKAYGVWLMLFAAPSYFAIADLGFASAAGNDMTMSVARGERDEALATFQAVRVGVLVLGGLLLAVTAAVIWIVLPHALDGAQAAAGGRARLATFLLMAYGLMALQNSVSMAGFRATRGYALGTAVQSSVNLAESVVALGVVVAGGGILGAACAYAALRLLGGIALAGALRFHAPWLMSLRWQSSMRRLVHLASPAGAVMVLPAAQVVFLQGTVLAVGAAAGAAAAPAFVATRTLSRVAVQVTSIVNHALMPEFTLATAGGDERRRRRLASLSLATSLMVILPVYLAMVIFGPQIVSLWTHGRIKPAPALVVMFALMMMINGVWHPISNLILAMNRQSAFTYRYLVLSVVAVGLAYPLSRLFGSPGGAAALVLLDLAMLVHVWGQARRMGILDTEAMVEDWRRSMKRLGRSPPADEMEA